MQTPSDQPSVPPKKKPNVLWWVGGGFALLVFLFFFQLFGPNPRIIVSPQTTHITSPLGPDGLPDYEQYVLEKARDGVTPENNAAVLLWQAMWPGELEPSQYAALVTELGLEKVPAASEALNRLYDNANREVILRWFEDQDVQAEIENFDQPHVSNSDLVESAIDQAMSRPWTSEQIPPLAKWVADNKQPLDLMVQASHRPRCYFPSPSTLKREREALLAMLLPGPQMVREAGRSLPARAMWHAGEGRMDEAWQDLLAVHRIGRLTAQGLTLVEQLVGIAIEGMAWEGTTALLGDDRLSLAQARQIQRDVESLNKFDTGADCIDSMERLQYLDTIIQCTKEDNRELFEVLDIGQPVPDINFFIKSTSVDWNIALQKGNEFHDRLVNAARLPDRAARDRAFAQFDADLKQVEHTIYDPASRAAAAISPRQRSEIAAAVTVSIFLPAIHAAIGAQDRVNAQLELLRLAAALAVFRAENREYPDKLDELVPGVIDKLPVDLYNGKPFVYTRTDDGYLLYNAGPNGADDGGSHLDWAIFEGRRLDDMKFNEAERDKLRFKIPASADDMSIRVPRPKWELPKLPSTSEP